MENKTSSPLRKLPRTPKKSLYSHVQWHTSVYFEIFLTAESKEGIIELLIRKEA